MTADGSADRAASGKDCLHRARMDAEVNEDVAHTERFCAGATAATATRALDDHARCCSIHGAAPVAVSRPRAMPPPADARRASGGECPPARIGLAARLATRRPPRSVAAVAFAGAASSSSPSSSSPAAAAGGGRGASSRARTKRLYLVRHGRTEMNEYLAQHRWDDPDFVDPGLYDTRLTALGMEQAASLRPVVAALDPKPELIVASPLSRALLTADLAFGDLVAEEDADAPRRVTCAFARERVFHASDVGRTPDEIAHDFPGWCLRETREVHGDVWWYTGNGDGTGRDETGRDGTGRPAAGRRLVASGYLGDAVTLEPARVRGADGETVEGSAREESTIGSSRTGGFCFPHRTRV